MKSEEAIFSSIVHCCRPKCYHLFSLLLSLCSLHPKFVAVYQLLCRRSYLRAGWWHTTSFSSLKSAQIYNRNLSTCVLIFTSLSNCILCGRNQKCKDIYFAHRLYLYNIKLEKICSKQICSRMWSEYRTWRIKRSGIRNIENGIRLNYRVIYGVCDIWSVKCCSVCDVHVKMLTSVSAFFRLLL
jgi:hypothetical protein